MSNWNEFRYSFYSGLLAASTQMVSVMANGQEIEITDTLIITTVLTFIIHYAKESKNFIAKKINVKD